MPDDAAAAVTVRLRGGHGRGDGGLDGVKLVVAGTLLDHAAAALLEDDEMAEVAEEAVRLEDAFDQHLKLGDGLWGDRVPLNGPPWEVPLVIGRERADPCPGAVGDDGDGVEGEE